MTQPAGPDPMAPRTRHRSHALGFLAVFVTCVLSYLPSLDHHLLNWDDDRIVLGDPFLTRISWDGVVDFFAQPRNEAYQPLHRLSYWLDVPWFGFEPRALHATNVLLWSLASGIWYLVFRRNRLGLLASLLGTLWFALHPCQVEAVVWVTGRKDCLASLFVALSCLAFCRGKRVWAALAYLCAALSKTTSLPLPLVFVCWELTQGRSWWPAVRAQLVSLVTMVGLGTLLVTLWSSHDLVRPSPLNRALLSSATLGHYVTTALWPAHPAPLHAIWYTPGDIPASVWLGLLALAVAFVAWRSDRTMLFSLLAFGCMLLPVLNLVPLYFQLADRYLSLPLAALGLGVAVLSERFPVQAQARASILGSRANPPASTFGSRANPPASTMASAPRMPPVGALLLTTWCVLLLVANVRYQRAWASDIALWSEGTRVQPNAFYAWLQLGHAQRNAGAYPQAVDAYQRAVDIQPDLALGHAALFQLVARHEISDPARAEQVIKRYLRALSRPELLDALAEELIHMDARNSAALVLARLFDSGVLTPAQKQVLLASARASGTPWVARAIELVLRGQPLASADLR